MKPTRVLRIAQEVLAIRQKIVTAHVANRNRMILQREEVKVQRNKQRLESAQYRFGVIELLAKVKAMTPPAPVDPVEDIQQRERRVMADLEAKTNIRAAAEQAVRAHAAQAAFDRADFIAQVKRDLPEEAWAETIDDYDRRVYEGSQDGGS